VIDRDAKIDLGAVEQTLLLPLLARARDAEKGQPILGDTHARDMVARIDYDFSKLEHGRHTANDQLGWTLRAWSFDSAVREFLGDSPGAAVVNIGAGLDTTFRRVDNGSVLWINIELPDVVALRRRLIPDLDREISIGSSVLDFSWMDEVDEQAKGRPILFVSAGVLFYFEATEVESLFRALAGAYRSSHFIFDAISRRLWLVLTNWMMHRAGRMQSAARLRWHLKRAAHLRRWVGTIKVIDEYSMFSRVQPRADWSKRLVRDIRIANRLRVYNMIHVQF
jgi:O-methyltransferase involved in polyketide biosynthesis